MTMGALLRQEAAEASLKAKREAWKQEREICSVRAKLGLPDLPLRADRSLFGLADLVSDTDTESDSDSDDDADTGSRADDPFFGIADLVESDEEVPDQGRGPDLFAPLDTNIEGVWGPEQRSTKIRVSATRRELSRTP